MKSASSIVRFLCCFVMAFIASFASAQSSAPVRRITREVDASTRTTLAGTMPAAIKSARDLGEVESGRSLQRMMLVMRPSPEQQAALNRLVEDQNNKNSASYHKWWKPEQFAAQFGPSDEDLAKVTAWMQSQGLNPTGVSKGRQWIEFSGTAQQVNSAFRTSMHQYERSGQKHIANASDISIPAALSPVVSGVLSLNDFRKAPAHSAVTHVKLNQQGKLAPVAPTYTRTDGNGNYFFNLAPADFQSIYSESPLLKSGIDGTGVSIAVAGRVDISLQDVQTFRQIFGLPANDPNLIINGPDPGVPSTEDEAESTLDVEWTGAAAPGATINFVTSASSDTTDGIDLSNAYIVDNAVSPIVSLSYGECEPLIGPAGNQFYNALWQQAAAEGITVFVSTGDSGAAQCDGDLQRNNAEPQGPALHDPTISGLSSTPFNVAVGGTQLNEANEFGNYWSSNNDLASGSALGYIPEQAWNQSCDPTLPTAGTNCAYGQNYYVLGAGGGGPSTCSQSTVDDTGLVTCIAGYAKPSWQTGAGVPADGVRDTPDLALNASPYDEAYLFCFLGGCQTQNLNGQNILTAADTIGGTSAATPGMAGIMALVEQKNGTFQGQANAIFYKLAAMDAQSSCDSSTRTDPTQPSACTFNDITLGSNSVPGLPGYGTSTADWTAGTGYDLATGLGSVNAANLAANWSKVTLAGSATKLTTTGTTLNHGQPLSLQIAVTSTATGTAIPTGDVALVTDKYGEVGQITLDASGNYSGQVSNLPGGSYNLTARYAGDGSFGSSVSAPIALTVGSEDSAVTVAFNVVDTSTGRLVPYTGTSQYANPLYMQVQVAGKSGQGLPTGTFNVLNGGKVVLAQPLTASGTATVTTGYAGPYIFPVGTNSVSVQYLGDSSFNPSTSAVQPIAIQPQQVQTLVGSTSTLVPVGQTVLLNAVIFLGPGPVLPTGTFQFYDNGQPFAAPITISNAGKTYVNETYAATFTTAGQHVITVGYSGDANYAPVTGTVPDTNSQAAYLQITDQPGEASVTTIVQTPTTVTYGQSLIYKVKVAATKAGDPVPTGAVVVSSNAGGGGGGFVNLVNGEGSVISQPEGGIYKVYAQYLGDSNYAPSTSAVITTTVATITPPSSLTSSANYALPGEQTSLNLTLTGYSFGQYGNNTPNGSAQFFTSVNGGPQQAITLPLTIGITGQLINSGISIRAVLPTGTNVVTAKYYGNQDFSPLTTAPVTVVVSDPDFTVNSGTPTLTVSAGGTASDALTVTPFLGFTGAVSLSCASGLPAGTTCGFSPASLQAGGGQSNLTITMQGPFTTQAANAKRGWKTGTELCGLAGLFLLGLPKRRRKMVVMLLVVVVAFGPLSGCGGGSSPSSTAVVVESSQTKAVSGAGVTFTAQVEGGDKASTGTVTFYDGSIALGSAATITNGAASVQVSNLAVGTHSITAKYSGDSNHSASSSQPLYQAITGTTTLQVVATSGSVSHAMSINLTVQ